MNRKKNCTKKYKTILGNSDSTIKLTLVIMVEISLQPGKHKETHLKAHHH